MTATSNELLDRYLCASNAHVIAALLGWRAQLRSGVSDKLRPRLEHDLRILSREAKRRGLNVGKSRALYPASGSNTVIRLGSNGEVWTETFGTPRPPNKPKRPPKKLKKPPVDLLEALQASIEQEVQKKNEKT